MNRITETAIQYRIGIFWFCLFSLNSLGTCLLAASSGCVWDNLDWQSRVNVILALIVNWTGTIMAYVSKAAKKIEQGQNPIGDGDTQIITKSTDTPKPLTPSA